MNSFVPDCFKRRWPLDRRLDNGFIGSMTTTTTSFPSPPPPPHFSGSSSGVFNLKPDGDELIVSSLNPAVTVVLEGRSICQRISLQKHGSYESLAKALRVMFVEEDDENENGFDLSNAVPGHLIAYEDIENDLLLAGDLNWNDFVRVAKRIRILPVKENSRRGRPKLGV